MKRVLLCVYLIWTHTSFQNEQFNEFSKTATPIMCVIHCLNADGRCHTVSFNNEGHVCQINPTNKRPGSRTTIWELLGHNYPIKSNRRFITFRLFQLSTKRYSDRVPHTHYKKDLVCNEGYKRCSGVNQTSDCLSNGTCRQNEDECKNMTWRPTDRFPPHNFDPPCPNTPLKEVQIYVVKISSRNSVFEVDLNFISDTHFRMKLRFDPDVQKDEAAIICDRRLSEKWLPAETSKNFKIDIKGVLPIIIYIVEFGYKVKVVDNVVHVYRVNTYDRFFDNIRIRGDIIYIAKVVYVYEEHA